MLQGQKSTCVESRMGASTDAERRPVSHPRSSNRTCPIKASGFPAGFTADSRTRLHLETAELQYAQLPEHRWDTEAVGAAGVHLVTPPQEMPYALINVIVNRPIRRDAGPVAEVRRPAPQNLIQPVPHFLPGPRVAGYQKVSHLFLDACHCLLRRTGSQIPMAILLVAMRPVRVTQKAEALLTRLLDAGLRLIQGDPHACYHLPRPIQCLGRFAATENHEVIRVVHYMGIELLSPFGVPPTLQQTVHVQVGEHGAGHSTLRSPAVAILPSRQPTLPVLLPLLDRGLQPHLNQTQHIPIDNSASHTL